MRTTLFRLLKGLSVACVSFLWLPGLMVLGISVGMEETGAFWAGPIGVLLLFGGLGMAYKLFLHPRIEKSCGLGLVLANLGSILLAAGCGALGLFLAVQTPGIPAAGTVWGNLIRQIALGLLFAGDFLGGSLAAERRYGDILTNLYFCVLVGADAVCLLLAWFLKHPTGGTVLAVCLLIAAGVSAFSRNQSGIDFLMERRKHSLSHLPAKMRWYSLALTGGGFALVALGFLLRGQLAGALRWCLAMLKEGLGVLLRWLFRGSGGAEVPEEPAPSNSDSAVPEMLPPGSSSIFWTIFGYAVLAAGVFFLFYYRRQILAFLRSLFRKIFEALRRVLFRKRQAAGSPDDSGDYRDDVEDLPREPAPEPVKRRRPYDYRRWKRDYRAFRAMAEGPEKAREGYRLAMLYLLLTRTPLSPADTPEEILTKAGSRLPPELFRQVTEFYRQVRYRGERVSDSGMERLSALLSECARMIS